MTNPQGKLVVEHRHLEVADAIVSLGWQSRIAARQVIVDAIAGALAAAEAGRKVCRWTYDSDFDEWVSGCGGKRIVFPDGDFPQGATACLFCGGRLIVEESE